MTDYERFIRTENKQTMERLSILKKMCEENNLTLTEYLLDEVQDELYDIKTELGILRGLKEKED